MNSEKLLDIIRKKTDFLMGMLPADGEKGLSGGCNGDYLSKTDNLMDMNQWTHSFFTGIISYLFLETDNVAYIEYLHKAKNVYSKKIFKNYRETMHDLGFLYTLFGVALYKITGDEESKHIALRAADELGKRFQFKAGIIQAWGQMDNQFEPGMMICDCMMNLPLLFWAYEETKHPFYLSVAVSHADSAVKYLVRDDYSVRHAYSFDVATGMPKCERNYCGYALGSAWARGTAWMIYGMAIAYSYTHNISYRETAIGITQFYLDNTGADGVPVYDFRAPENEKRVKDTSAAAIAACGMLELAKHTQGQPIAARCIKTAELVLDTLSEKPYFANEKSQGLLKYEARGEEGVAIWGDYFFVELFERLKHPDNFVRFW